MLFRSNDQRVDNQERRARGGCIAEELSRFVPPVADALIVGQALDAVRVHALYTLEVPRW